MKDFTKKYPHIAFKKQWTYTREIYFTLGECASLLKAITNTPIMPDYLEILHSVALIKGAQATTAIEGNTLTVEEIQELQKGKKLPPSKEYLGIEVKNIIKALDKILKETITEKKIKLITPELIKEFHSMVGGNLGEHFQAVPGKFRNNNVIVGNYRPPDYRDVLKMIEFFSKWLRTEFKFENNQTFSDAVLQSIVTHVYIAWIHPFSDGNGRTARLLEFYLLLRSGVPDIASHILSNFYNITRSEYYRQLQNATKKRDLTDFITYALIGFKDGLSDVLKTIQENQLLITWKNFVYGIFDKKMAAGKTRKANKRRRNLVLEIPHDKYFSIDEIRNLKTWIIKEYAVLSERSFLRDLDELIAMDLLKKDRKGYRAKVELLKKFMALKLEKD